MLVVHAFYARWEFKLPPHARVVTASHRCCGRCVGPFFLRHIWGPAVYMAAFNGPTQLLSQPCQNVPALVCTPGWVLPVVAPSVHVHPQPNDPVITLIQTWVVVCL